MQKINLKNLFFLLALSLAIFGYVSSLKCYYCENCDQINLKRPSTFKKASVRKCLGGQKYCIRAEQKSISNGREQMKVVALGCTTECNEQSYANTGLKATCCTKNNCNLPRQQRNDRKDRKGRKGRKDKGRKKGRSAEESFEE